MCHRAGNRYDRARWSRSTNARMCAITTIGCCSIAASSRAHDFPVVLAARTDLDPAQSDRVAQRSHLIDSQGRVHRRMKLSPLALAPLGRLILDNAPQRLRGLRSPQVTDVDRSVLAGDPRDLHKQRQRVRQAMHDLMRGHQVAGVFRSISPLRSCARRRGLVW